MGRLLFETLEKEKLESNRLEDLLSYRVLDTPADTICDYVTKLAVDLFGAEISLVALLDERRQWFMSATGVSCKESSHEDSFCSHIVGTRKSIVVLDASEDSRFSRSPMVRGAPFIRFYAGVPLMSSAGNALGTLCIASPRPRTVFGSLNVARLQNLAGIVTTRLEQLRNGGQTDHITNLPNRTKFVKELRSRTFNQNSVTSQCTAVAVDICSREYFFDMVKALGWDYVEAFLVQASNKLVSLLPAIPLYRIGPTTFAYLELVGIEAMNDRIAAIHKLFSSSMETQGIPHQLEIAVGVIPSANETLGSDVVRSLLTVIDVSREEGISPCIYEPSLVENQRYAFWLLSAMPIAFGSGGELELHYQPKLCLRDGSCATAEALVRWNHPILGNISPGTFIPLAEKTAIIRQITAWVMRAAVAQIAIWMARGHAITLAVNTSARDFESDELPQLLAYLLARHGVPAEMIEIEFTESAMACSQNPLRKRLQAIKDLGIKVALDDFGAGFSNLSYLKKIPADYVKIDQCFVRGMIDNHDDQMIVPSIINLAQKLGYEVIAEGVETEKICRILRNLGCDYAQGYAIARPMSAPDFEEWIGIGIG